MEAMSLAYKEGGRQKGFRACKAPQGPHGFRILSSLSFSSGKWMLVKREWMCRNVPGTWRTLTWHDLVRLSQSHVPVAELCTCAFHFENRLSVESK